MDETMSETMTGGCACGAIRYMATAPPVMMVHCHCRACQRASGGGHGTHVAVPASALALEGAPRFHSSQADSGNAVHRGFCAACGSPVISRNDGYPDMVVLAAASLDDPGIVEPQMAVFAARAQPWDHLDPALPRVPGMPGGGGAGR